MRRAGDGNKSILESDFFFLSQRSLGCKERTSTKLTQTKRGRWSKIDLKNKTKVTEWMKPRPVLSRQ